MNTTPRRTLPSTTSSRSCPSSVASCCWSTAARASSASTRRRRSTRPLPLGHRCCGDRGFGIRKVIGMETQTQKQTDRVETTHLGFSRGQRAKSFRVLCGNGVLFKWPDTSTAQMYLDVEKVGQQRHEREFPRYGNVGGVLCSALTGICLRYLKNRNMNRGWPFLCTCAPGLCCTVQCCLK